MEPSDGKRTALEHSDVKRTALEHSDVKRTALGTSDVKRTALEPSDDRRTALKPSHADRRHVSYESADVSLSLSLSSSDSPLSGRSKRSVPCKCALTMCQKKGVKVTASRTKIQEERKTFSPTSIGMSHLRNNCQKSSLLFRSRFL